ncbi:hypothetical protein DFJ43DRAFT_471888 [Lentinula guzmanii]|uniref:Uncharacterized protein n=1 Tax=Lentinula guzmanii TaxID=2804957 RepID=A0AA38MYA5_9AGAR|nr:hypothetical protein DFJ43DRAFT_471888 [Lentinula guzmanii]
MLIPVVESHPRLFTTEEDSRKLKDRVKALRVETDRIPEESRLDDYCNWWNSLSDFVGILEGRGEVIQRICLEGGRIFRPCSMLWPDHSTYSLYPADVLDSMLPDPTSLEDILLSCLFSAHTEKTLKHASSFDLRLSAHLAGITEPLGLRDAELDSESHVYSSILLVPS